MHENMIYVPLEDYQKKCKAEAEFEMVNRYLDSCKKYGSYDELMALKGEFYQMKKIQS